jgi:hypothetical protein
VELEKLHERVDGVEDERVTEAVQLSWSVMEISNALVNLGVFPIRDIPAQPKSADDVLTVVNLVLERLWEEHASITGSDIRNSACTALLQPPGHPTFHFSLSLFLNF